VVRRGVKRDLPGHGFCGLEKSGLGCQETRHTWSKKNETISSTRTNLKATEAGRESDELKGSTKKGGELRGGPVWLEIKAKKKEELEGKRPQTQYKH